MLRRIMAFVVAATAMVVLGSAAHSYFVQTAWSAAAGHADGAAPAVIPFADRISWAVHDLGGMIVPYGGLTSISLLIAVLAAGALARASGRRVMLFGVAGAAAMLVLFTALKIFLGTVAIFGARGTIGLATQMAAGLIGGVVFARLTPPGKS